MALNDSSKWAFNPPADPVSPDSCEPKPKSKKLWLITIIGVVGGPLLTSMGIYEHRQYSQLPTKGVTVPGRLFETNTFSKRRSNQLTYLVTIDYDPQGLNTHRKSFNVPKEIFERTVLTRQLPVTYLPSDPFVSIVDGDATLHASEGIAIGVGVTLFGAFLLFVLRPSIRIPWPKLSFTLFSKKSKPTGAKRWKADDPKWQYPGPT